MDDEIPAGWRMLQHSLDAEIVVRYKPAGNLPAVSTLARTRGRVLACEACGLRDGCSSPVPYSWPTQNLISTPKFIVVGEGPGGEEDRRGEPFVGRSGQLLRRMFKEAGLDDYALCNVVSCFPHESKAKARPPTDEEMQSCRSNLLSQLDTLCSPYVLLAGTTALSAFRSDLKISNVHGEVFVWLGRFLVMPVYHPAYILRNIAMKSVTMGDLERWKGVVGEELPWSMYLGERCVRCSAYYSDYDPDGVPYCFDHYRRYKKTWKTQRRRWLPKGSRITGLG